MIFSWTMASPRAANGITIKAIATLRRRGAAAREPASSSNDVSDIVAMLDRCQVPTFGRIDPKRLIWPVTRKQALAQLAGVRRSAAAPLRHLPGRHDSRQRVPLPFPALFRAQHQNAQSHGGDSGGHCPVPVDFRRKRWGSNNWKGFVRQILGWREYMRGIYWAHMPAYASMNHFGHSADLPDFYWTGDTRMNCLRSVISQSLEHAYAHHIQRLMITGNFALLAGIHPDEVDSWYLGIYIDAVQWVEIVNTRGMSQFADGGMVATKPYVSSANYIHKMSDYCDDCHYQWRKNTGDRACPFNSFYWAFIHRHRQKLAKNPRVAMMFRTWDRMKDDKQRELLTQAENYQAALNAL
jgi:deoxyribodipyrimidine photolyase-related protein